MKTLKRYARRGTWFVIACAVLLLGGDPWQAWEAFNSRWPGDW